MNRTKMTSRWQEAGFSLPEVLVSMALLSVALVSVAGLMMQSAQVLQRSVRQMQALALASAVVDVLQDAGATDPWLQASGDLEFDSFHVRWVVRSVEEIPEVRHLQVTVSHDGNRQEYRLLSLDAARSAE